MTKLQELNRERLIKAFGLQNDLVALTAGLKTYRTRKSRREAPGSDQLTTLENRDGCARQVALVLFVRPFQLYRGCHRADAKMRIIRRRQLGQVNKCGVGIIIINDQLQGVYRQINPASIM